LPGADDQRGAGGLASKIAVDVAFGVRHVDDAGSFGQALAGHLRANQPTRGLLLLQRPAVVLRCRLAAASPDPRVHHTEQRLARGIHRDNGMNEEPDRAIAVGSQAATRTIAPGEVHRRRVLHRHNAPSPTGRRRPLGNRRHDLVNPHRRRGQEAVQRNLAGAIAAKPPYHQRPRRHDPLQKKGPYRGAPRIAKLPDDKAPSRHQHPLAQPREQRIKLQPAPPENCVNAVAA